MKKNILVLAYFALMLSASSARAGWYEVKNYVGLVREFWGHHT